MFHQFAESDGIFTSSFSNEKSTPEQVCYQFIIHALNFHLFIWSMALICFKHGAIVRFQSFMVTNLNYLHFIAFLIKDRQHMSF